MDEYQPKTRPGFKEPPIHPSKLPQYVPPSRASRALQIGAFALSGFIGVYMVLFHDFGDRDHVFVPARRWVDEHTHNLFILSDAERRTMGLKAAVEPSHRSPVEFFKEEFTTSKDREASARHEELLRDKKP